MAPERLRHTNPDPILCLILLVIIPMFGVWTVYYPIRRSTNSIIQRPFKLRPGSWNRNPINWWGDPLQSLFISMSYMAAMAVGAALRRPAFGTVGFWTFGVYCCLAVGLLIGQLLAYRIFRERITMSDA